MQHGLLEGGQDWPPPPPPRPPRRHRLLITASVLVVAAAAGVVSAEVYGAVSGPAPAPAPTPTTTTTPMPTPGGSLAARIDPGLVDVAATLGYEQLISDGTGMVLSPSGLVITNNHVIEEATSVTVTDVGNHRSYTADIVGYDQSADIAVLQLKGAAGLRTVSLASSATVKAGEKVLALGNAEGKGGTPAAATGTVTGLDQSITASDQAAGISEQLSGLIQTDVPIQPGDSGGALVSPAGQVIGMNTAGSSQFHLNSETTQAYAIPASQLAHVAAAITAGRASAAIHLGATAFLGVQVLSSGVPIASNPARTGAGVVAVTAGTPADVAGLVAGDVIVSIGGHAVTSAMSLRSVLDGYHPGDKAVLSWVDPTGQAHAATVVFTLGPAG